MKPNSSFKFLINFLSPYLSFILPFQPLIKSILTFSSNLLHLIGVQVLDEPPSKSMPPGSAPSTSTPFDRSSGNNDNTPNKAAPLSR